MPTESSARTIYREETPGKLYKAVFFVRDHRLLVAEKITCVMLTRLTIEKKE